MNSAVIRVRLDLRYDGSKYSGWARQADQPSLQQTIEEALETVVRAAPHPTAQPQPQRRPMRLVVAGRTDAGVHATGQVAHVDINVADWHYIPGRLAGPPEHVLGTRLRGVLPRDILVWRVTPVTADFDARFSALWRRYRYRISDSTRTRDPLRRNHVLHHSYSLNADLMHAAAQTLLGEHDFFSYCKPRPHATTVRTLLRLDVTRLEEHLPDGGLVSVDVVADAFCHSMVRSLVGSLLEVGQGWQPLTWPAQVLEQRERGVGGAVAPAHGLTLEEVGYPETAELAARAKLTRALRN